MTILTWFKSFTALFVFLVFGIAAYLIVGYLHHDEHFQILEFANYKRGLVEAQFLPWEFAARLRPSLQPTLAFLFLNLAEVTGLHDPFKQAFVTRLLSVALFLYSTYKLYEALKGDFRTEYLQNLFLFASFLFYIFPLTGARFSSENWSSCFYVLAFARLYPMIRKWSPRAMKAQDVVFVGFLFGLSFLFRYQAAIMIGGLAAWLLLFRFGQFRYWVIMFGGFLIAAVIGVFFDRWFYGEWAVTAFNYFTVNLMEGKAATFGVEPWWWYLARVDMSKWMIVLNSLVLLFLAVFLIRKFRHPVTWVFFPFLFIHFLIGHKESRFIYPILVFVPFMIASVVQLIDEKLKRPVLLGIVLLPFVVINMFAFVAISFAPLDNSTEAFKYIRELPTVPIVMYYDDARFYYTLNDGTKDITTRFYKSGRKVILRKEPGDMSELTRLTVGGDTLAFAVLDWGDQERYGNQLKQVYDPEPAFVKALNYRNWMRLGHGRWKLYQVGVPADRP